MTTVAYVYLAVGVCMLLLGIVMLLLSKRVKKAPIEITEGMIVCTSNNRPSAWLGRTVMYETDTNKYFYYDGDLKDWIPFTGKHFVKERRLMGPPR